MRRPVHIVLFLAFAAFADVDPRLRIAEYGDPYAVPPPVAVSNFNVMATAFVPRETESYTFLVWHRSIAPAVETRYIAWSLSTESARATKEGGAELPAIREYAPITLSAGGTWSMSGLPAQYDMPAGLVGLDKWQYGCFCVNVLTQTPLTITVAGAERQIPASNEKQIFNIIGEAADRSVTISAADPSAPVDFGIAVNPLKQFFGGNIEYAGGFSATSSENDISNACVLSVMRAEMTAGGASVHWKEWWRTVGGKEMTKEYTKDCWKSRAAFAKDARIEIRWFGNIVNYCETEVYGGKYFPRWLTDAEIDRIYDADLEVIKARRYMGEQQE